MNDVLAVRCSWAKALKKVPVCEPFGETAQILGETGSKLSARLAVWEGGAFCLLGIWPGTLSRSTKGAQYLELEQESESNWRSAHIQEEWNCVSLAIYAWTLSEEVPAFSTYVE